MCIRPSYDCVSMVNTTITRLRLVLFGDHGVSVISSGSSGLEMDKQEKHLHCVKSHAYKI